ncbi:MAG: GntR family transcriptional regulator [bacterium]
MVRVFPVDPTDPTPLYAQLDRGIRAAIASGRLNAGDKLPTVRQLAVDLRINANTVAKVYAELERAGVLATQRGIGTFVRDTPTPAASTTRRDRERDLRPLVDRLLADASAIGVSFPEVVQYIKTLEARSTKERT